MELKIPVQYKKNINTLTIKYTRTLKNAEHKILAKQKTPEQYKMSE